MVSATWLEAFARALLDAADPLPSGRALAALSSELEEEAAQWFLRLVGINLAFRLRSDGLLASLLRFAARARPPLDPIRLGRLLVRARSARDARALLEASPLAPEDRARALEAARPLREPRLEGARVHLAGDPNRVRALLAKALRPWTELPWTQATTAPDVRRFLLLRRRGGWSTLLEEGDRLPVTLAEALARAGAKQVAWASFGGEGEPDLVCWEGSRRVLDRADLRERLGEAPCEDDVAGALRARGILDLDPEHPRGEARLGFLANLDRDLRKRGVTPLAFAPAP